MREYLFLYGTLIPSQATGEVAELMKQLRRVGLGYVQGRLYDLGEYPGAVLDPSSNTKITGEIFEIRGEQDVLASLDSYEEFNPKDLKGSLFVRVQTLVNLSDGRNLKCWLYSYNKNPGSAPLIIGGNYGKYKAA